MVIESWVIIFILAIITYLFIRGHRKTWAIAIIPLTIVPFLNIIYYPISRKITDSTLYDAHLIRIIIYIISFIVMAVWAFLFAKTLPRGRSKYAYLFSSIVFTAILIIIFIVKIPA